MKKIILGVFLMVLFGGSLSFGQSVDCKSLDDQFVNKVNGVCPAGSTTTSYNDQCCTTDAAAIADAECKKNDNLRVAANNGACSEGYESASETCCKPDAKSASQQAPSAPDQTINGMTIGKTCLLNGQCKFSFYKFLGIRQSVEGEGKDPTSPELFIQDIILAATTFIGTLLAVSLIVSGLMYIFAGASGKEPTKAKSGIINSIIGLVIVLGAYAIIRLVQYIAKGF